MTSRPLHSHAHAGRHRGLRLPQRDRRTVCAVAALLWLTGIAWLVLHYFFARQGEFGSEPHPLEAWSLRLHGAAVFAALWTAGLVWAIHAREGLARRRRRVSGIVLIAMFVWLAVSGYVLYYATDDALREGARLLHWLVGLAAVLPFLIHVLRARRRRKDRESRTAPTWIDPGSTA